MASEFTIDIQLTELGFHNLPVFNEELPVKETPQISSSCTPPNIPAPSISPPPVTSLPVNHGLLSLVQQNVHTLPKSFPVAAVVANTPSQSNPDTGKNVQPQSPQYKTVSENNILPEKAASLESNTKTKPVSTAKQTQAIGEKDNGNMVTTEKRAFIGHHESEERSSAEKKAASRKGASQTDGAISQDDSNHSKGNADEESDDSEVSEPEEEEEEEDTDDDSQLFAPDVAGEHRCSMCHQTFSNSFLLREHMHLHTGVRPYRCAECGKQFCHLANYRTHLRAHAQAVPIRCRVCQANFETEEHLQVHLERTHFEKEFYQCDFCKRIFTCLTECKYHVQKHKSEVRKPQCPQCNRQFTLEKSLQRHMRKHTCQRTFLCSDCGQGFRKKNALLRHSFSHLGLLPYTCTHCKTHFRLANLYRKHKCKPESIQCVACLSTFTSHRDFEEHKKATGCWGYQGVQGMLPQQDEIRCMECGQTFATADELKKHAGSHQRVLKCAECGMGFRSALMLMSHMGGHVGQRPCLCQQCGLGFPHQQGYDLHLKDCGTTPPKVVVKKTKTVQMKPVKKQRPIAPKTTAPAPEPEPEPAPEPAPVPAPAPTSPQNSQGSQAEEVNTGNEVQTPPPEPTVPDQPAKGVWKLSLDKRPPPNTPLVVLLPISAGVPSNLTVSAEEPQNLILAEKDYVAPLDQPPQGVDANVAPKPLLKTAVLDNTEAPQALLCKQQQLISLPQPCLNTSVIKTEPKGTIYSEVCTLSAFGNTCDVLSAVQVKKEESEEETKTFKFCEEDVKTAPLKTETKLKVEFQSDLKTEIQVEDLSFINVIKESTGFDKNNENLEQSDLLISDVRSHTDENLEQSNLLMSGVGRESSVSDCFKRREEQTQQCETETCSLVPDCLEAPLDLRLNVKHSVKCPDALSQEIGVSSVTEETDVQGHRHHELEANKVTEDSSYFTTVEVDLRDELEEVDGEPHECVTCGQIILEGDLVQHYMEHAVQGGQDLTEQTSRSRSPSPSRSSSSSYSPSSGLSSPNTTPPASPPSKRLRSRAK